MNKELFVKNDATHPYPRLCAHRGLSSLAPENSLPAYGAAAAFGADEIELDVWASKDGALVSLHDRKLERLSDGEGEVYEYTLNELKKLDFGVKFSDSFKGLRLLTLEDLLKKLGRTVIMNIHMKMWDLGNGDPKYEELYALIKKYNCTEYVYVTSISEEHLENFHKIAPEISRCMPINGKRKDLFEYLDKVSRFGLQKIQISSPTKESIEFIHKNGMICNVYYADTYEKAKTLLEIGADTILSNNIIAISAAFDIDQS